MGNDQSKPSEEENKKVGQIVVVKEKPKSASSTKETETITRLSECPKFTPLVPNLLSRADSRPLSSELVHRLSHQGTFRLCLRLQKHFHLLTETVKSDQSDLCKRIKQVDKFAVSVMQKLNERQSKLLKFTELSHQIDHISTLLNRIEINLNQSSSTANLLNMQLSETERLLPITF